MLLVQGIESADAHAPTAGDSVLWSAADRAWASRLARETVAAGSTPAQYIAERAGHTLQRLASREAGVTAARRRRLWRPLWLLLALVLGFVAGMAVDAIGSSQRISLLAPPVWAVIGWNLLVYAGLLASWARLTRGLPRGPLAWLQSGLQSWSLRAGAATGPWLLAAQAQWARQSLPLTRHRLALLLHAAAAALGLGLIMGLYLRGLVLDYRAGWQSTFLDAAAVQGLLSALLAPAVALTGIAVPDAQSMAAMRVVPGVAASASAAPWIHLYASMLALFVCGPRLLLALAAAWRARRLARQFPLNLDEPYFRRLLRERSGVATVVQVLPHATQPSALALSGLQELLALAADTEVEIDLGERTEYGDEDRAASLLPAPGTSLRLVLVDLTTTPEAETQGRFLAALRDGSDLLVLLLADEAAFARRFAQVPERLAPRRQAWAELAQAQGVAWFSANLERAEPQALAPDGLAPLRRALGL